MDAGEGDSDAIPFSRPHPRSKPQTVVENLHRNWNIERGHVRSTWEVRSSKVDLAEHVGHTVTATGVVSNAKMHNMKEDAKETAKDSGIKKDATEHGHMTITDVKMVSESCK